MGFPRCVTLLGLFLWLPGGKVYGDGADMSVGNCQRRTVTVSVPAAPIRQNAARRPDPESDKTPLGEALSISLRSDFPGELAIVDDLRSTDLPYFVIEVSGPSEEVGRVGWRQAWLANGTFYFHMRDRAAPDDDSLHLAPPAFWPTEHPTTPPGQSQNYVLRVSVMGALTALLLLLLLWALVALVRRRRGRHGGGRCCGAGRGKAGTAGSSELAANDIHFIPSSLLGTPPHTTTFGSREGRPPPPLPPTPPIPPQPPPRCHSGVGTGRSSARQYAQVTLGSDMVHSGSSTRRRHGTLQDALLAAHCDPPLFGGLTCSEEGGCHPGTLRGPGWAITSNRTLGGGATERQGTRERVREHESQLALAIEVQSSLHSTV